jgi:hypothetical protein
VLAKPMVALDHIMDRNRAIAPSITSELLGGGLQALEAWAVPRQCSLNAERKMREAGCLPFGWMFQLQEMAAWQAVTT